MEPITIRAATVEDVPDILRFIQKKAAFDVTMGRAEGGIETNELAIRKTMFSSKPYAYAFFAIYDSKPSGFALYYFRYSSFRGRPSIWLDDLYVDESVRGRGLGEALMRQLANEALSHGCVELAWNASARNEAGIRFYTRLGAREYDRRNSCLFFHVGASTILNLCLAKN
jgi:GNAT superfamily N-acetyltransferase